MNAGHLLVVEYMNIKILTLVLKLWMSKCSIIYFSQKCHIIAMGQVLSKNKSEVLLRRTFLNVFHLHLTKKSLEIQISISWGDVS